MRENAELQALRDQRRQLQLENQQLRESMLRSDSATMEEQLEITKNE